ncbi:Mob1/phocein, partial [Schizophyllum commune Tattone D]
MTAIFQRPFRGARISSFYPVKTLPSLASLDSAFQLQEYISLLIRLDVHDVERIVNLPEKSKNGDADGEKKTDANVDQYCWIYEQLRRLAQDLTHPLCTMLQLECNRQTCPEMKAGEWLYLCVAHGNDGAMEQCCAIDYILHTIDSATALLNSPRAFPSRLQIPTSSHRHFSALARRLGRIFAHAYFHHREAFEQAEAESSLYARFLALTQKFDLVPAEFLVIPPRVDPEAEVEPPRVLPPRQHHEPPTLDMNARARSPPGLGGSESPRKFGRNRTDTMVFSEAQSIAEELSRREHADVPAIPLEKAPEIHDKPHDESVHEAEHTEHVIAEEAAATDELPNTDTTIAPEEDPFADEHAEPSHAAEGPTLSHAEDASPPPTEDISSHAEDSPVEHEHVPVPPPTEGEEPTDAADTTILDAPTPAAEADPIMPATESPPAGADVIEEKEEPTASEAPEETEAAIEPSASSVEDPVAEAETKTSQDEEAVPHAQDEKPVESAEEKPAEDAEESAEESPEAAQDSEETPAEGTDAEAPSYAAAVAEGTEHAEAKADTEHDEKTDEHEEATDEAHGKQRRERRRRRMRVLRLSDVYLGTMELMQCAFNYDAQLSRWRC